MAAGKNLTVKQTSDKDGAKVEFALNNNVTNLDSVVVNGPKGKDGKDGKAGVTITAPGGKDGKDGLDGKVGISGKDGKDAVSISGKDGVGQIGLTGPKGKDGKDAASINITTDNGKQTLVNLENGAKGEPGETTQRIVYKPVDKDGNPIKGKDGKDITREVATMDDGLVFGGNSGKAHKAALGTQVNVKGHTANKDWTKFDGGKNIMTQVDGDTITVGLANDVNVDSVTTTNTTTQNLTVKEGGNVDMGGNQVHNVKAGTKDTDAVNVSQLKQSVGDVHKRINKVGKEARGGIAGANAAAGLPQVYIPGKSMVAASAGTFKGESAVAVGYSRSSDNGKVIFKLQGNANTQGDVGGSVGVGYQW